MIFLQKKVAAGGTPTFRTLVSTSGAANTGMHSTSDIPAISDDYNVAFWFKRDGANSNNTLWANEDGSDQIYIDSTQRVNARYGNNGVGGAEADFVVPDDTWVHVHVRFGLNVLGSQDVELTVTEQDGTTHTDGLDTASSASSTTTTAQLNFVFGDDPSSGTTTDDGFAGSIYQLGLLEGNFAVTDTGVDGSGNSQAMSSSALAAGVYLLFGTNASDAGEDYSSNGNDFTVESSGVTTSISDYPA